MKFKVVVERMKWVRRSSAVVKFSKFLSSPSLTNRDNVNQASFV